MDCAACDGLHSHKVFTPVATRIQREKAPIFSLDFSGRRKLELYRPKARNFLVVGGLATALESFTHAATLPPSAHLLLASTSEPAAARGTDPTGNQKQPTFNTSKLHKPTRSCRSKTRLAGPLDLLLGGPASRQRQERGQAKEGTAPGSQVFRSPTAAQASPIHIT